MKNDQQNLTVYEAKKPVGCKTCGGCTGGCSGSLRGQNQISQNQLYAREAEHYFFYFLPAKAHQ